MHPQFKIKRLSEATNRLTFFDDFSGFYNQNQRIERRDSQSSNERYTRILLEYGTTRQCEFWIAYDKIDQRIVSRLGADVTLTSIGNGSIGFFECELSADGEAASIILFNNAIEWLKQKNVNEIYGPMDFNSWFKYRFKNIRANNIPAQTEAWEPSSPKLYTEVFLKSGFQEALSYTSFHFEVTDNQIWDAYIRRLQADHFRVLKEGFSIREIGWNSSLEQDLRSIFDISNISFANNPMFEEIPFDLFAALTRSSANASNGGGSRICFSAQGQPVGFLFAFTSGDTVIYKTVAVLPDFQSAGIANAMTYQLCQFCKSAHIRKSIGALIRKGNTSEKIGHGFAQFALRSGHDDYVLLKRTLT